MDSGFANGAILKLDMLNLLKHH